MASDKSTSRRAIEDDEARPYVIVSDIGKGSFATVYKGYHEVCVSHPLSVWRFPTTWHSQETHHQVAIKVVRRDILTAKLLDNLQSEIEILKSLSHRHITKLIDIVVSAPSICSRSQLLCCLFSGSGSHAVPVWFFYHHSFIRRILRLCLSPYAFAGSLTLSSASRAQHIPYHGVLRRRRPNKLHKETRSRRGARVLALIRCCSSILPSSKNGRSG